MRKSNGGIKANGRFAFILFAFFAAFALMLGRVLYMKVVHGAEYEAAAKNQQINRYDITIPPNRGSIQYHGLQRGAGLLAAGRGCTAIS